MIYKILSKIFIFIKQEKNIGGVVFVIKLNNMLRLKKLSSFNRSYFQNFQITA